MATWEYVDIDVDGRRVRAQAPVIVSASRRTDIPAFYADWFFERLAKGYSAWRNPYNGARSYVSFAKMRFIVFWSKNPLPLLTYLDELRSKGIGCYVQYTLNDYEDEGLECVPPLEERIATFRTLVAALGKGGVVWRFDPLLLTANMGIEALAEQIQRIGDALEGYTEKMVFSYADIRSYRKVKRNLERSGIAYREWTESEMIEMASQLSALNQTRGWGYEIATCCESVDLSQYGIAHNRCIDGDLIVRRAWEDRALMDFMQVKIAEIPGPTLFGGVDYALPPGGIALPGNHYFESVHRKDNGQRELCGCMMAKDIGEYNTCPHLCEYCYANSSHTAALTNWRQHKEHPSGDSITGV